MTDNDLPLLSNINDIRARHYLIELKSTVQNNVFHGKVIIFFETTTLCEKNGKCCTYNCFCPSNKKGTSDELLSQSNSCEENPKCSWTATKSNSFCDTQESDTPVSPENLKEVNFKLILDCCDLKVKHVTEVLCSEQEVSEYLHPNSIRKCRLGLTSWSSKKQLPLEFSVTEWCIKIEKAGVKNASNFPQVICIEYDTSPQGKSVLWRNDQDGHPCVFTAAASINNRSLLPCQDPPSAMATWQSWITVPEGYYVSITGDECADKCIVSLESCEKEALTVAHAFSDDCKGTNSCNATFEGGDILESNSLNCFYYYTTMVLPIATIAIAIGRWEIKYLTVPEIYVDREQNKEIMSGQFSESQKTFCQHYKYPCHFNSDVWTNDTRLTIVYPPSIRELINPLRDFLPFALKAAVSLLGIYPCRRLEIVILPQSFGSLGLASPNLIFLSPTVVIEDQTAFIRVAHEISHAWFGINIGAQDWTEEWISEGFATYMEDSIYTEAILAYEDTGNVSVLPMSCSQQSISEPPAIDKEVLPERVTKQNFTKVTRHLLDELSDLRAHLRYRTLCSELKNSSEELQALMPMQGESLVADGVSFVKDGLNPEKTFLQVHYLKGYFLLKFLSKIIGRKKFDKLLRAYVTQYHGQLVLSRDILKFFIKACPEILARGITVNYLLSNWLHQPGLNDVVNEMFGTISNSLSLIVQQHYQYWISSNPNVHKVSSKKKIKVQLKEMLFSDQLVLLFEYFLELTKLHSRMLSSIYEHYKIKTQNADVRHRWCELVIKHNFHDLTEVQRFLVNDQSMGVYLYGELIISKKTKHRLLAEKIFTMKQKDMDENTKITVQGMLYGN